jgi:type IV fimbrial biogenesis protein FimT
MNRQRGFTAIEMMAVVVIAAILAALAAPSMRDMIVRNRISTISADLYNDFATARSTAIQRGVRVGICASVSPYTACSGTNWATGWIMYTDIDSNGTYTSAADGGAAGILRVREALPVNYTIAVTGTSGVITFRPSGPADVARTFQTCFTGFIGRQIDVTTTGRASSRAMTAACT